MIKFKNKCFKNLQYLNTHLLKYSRCYFSNKKDNKDKPVYQDRSFENFLDKEEIQKKETKKNLDEKKEKRKSILDSGTKCLVLHPVFKQK